MEGRPSQSSARPMSSKLSPLKQHPVSLGTPPSPDATQTIFLNHPTARLSSSPASSPRIIDPSPARRGSVHPAMSDTMERGLEPGADFFDDGSSGSEWEDSDWNFTQTFSGAEGLTLRSLIHGINEDDNDSARRGRSRERNSVTALPPFRHPPAQHSGFGLMDEDGATRARQMSVRRLSRDSVRLVHNRSNDTTPRGSVGSNTPSTRRPSVEVPPLPTAKREPDGLSPPTLDMPERLRRNTSESFLAGSIIDAHVHTMRALESLNASPSGILTSSKTCVPTTATSDVTKFPSFTNDRHITIPPLSTKEHEGVGDRPAHLPSHFIRTPYPFSPLKEFPKPKSRPRKHGDMEDPNSTNIYRFERLDSAHGDDDSDKECDGRKGKLVLGLGPSTGEYDLRSRLERNKEAQGIIDSHTELGPEGSDGIVWLSLQRTAQSQACYNHQARNLVKVEVPSSLTIKSPNHKPKNKEKSVTVDFDDNFLADRLRDGYRKLAGSWLRRTLSARKLRTIQLGQVSSWSGAQVEMSGQRALKLLATGSGLDTDADVKSPFTEEGLMKLYRHPKSGKARYTWVHWARHVAASNTPRQPFHPTTINASHRFAKSTDLGGGSASVAQPSEPPAALSLPDSIITIQFVRSLSKLRVLAVMTLMLALSVLAALCWVFLGPVDIRAPMTASSQRSNRVGSAMTLGILVLLFESVGFGAWAWLS